MLPCLYNLVSPLLQDKPIAHIFAEHREDNGICERTLYIYMEEYSELEVVKMDTVVVGNCETSLQSD